MTQVGATSPIGYTSSATGVPDVGGRTTGSGDGDVPPLAQGAGGSASTPFMPTLAKPKSFPVNLAGLALEQLVEAVGMETRQVMTTTGMDTLKSKAAERKEASDKSIAETQKQLEKMKEKEKLGPFMKALKWIGMALSAIASVATIAIGALTGNTLLIIAGSIMMAMTVNSILGAATDGKATLANGFAKLAEKFGASEETAKWIGFAVEMAITLVGVVLSFGAGASASAAKAVEAASKVAQIMNKVSQVTSVLSGLNTVAEGSFGIANSAFEYQITNSRASQKDLEAIMERIRVAIETETDFIEAIMERAEKLLSTVKDIVDGNSQMQATLAIQAPSVA